MVLVSARRRNAFLESSEYKDVFMDVKPKSYTLTARMALKAFRMNDVVHPNLLAASLTSNIVRCVSAWMRSSLSIRESTRASSPSMLRTGFGVLASRIK